MSSATLTTPSCSLCLVRHGETTWNTEYRLQGHLDIPLNSNGIRQAHATGRHLENIRFNAVYSSDLERAHTTAGIITQYQPISLEPVCLPDLRERHYGILQGLTHTEAEIQHPEVFHHFKARTPAYSLEGNGESLLDLTQRISTTLHDLIRSHPGEQILIVTHGGVLDTIYRIVTGADISAPRTWMIPNAAINWIEHADNTWRLREWAVQSHLEQARDELSTT